MGRRTRRGPKFELAPGGRDQRLGRTSKGRNCFRCPNHRMIYKTQSRVSNLLLNLYQLNYVSIHIRVQNLGLASKH